MPGDDRPEPTDAGPLSERERPRKLRAEIGLGPRVLQQVSDREVAKKEVGEELLEIYDRSEEDTLP